MIDYICPVFASIYTFLRNEAQVSNEIAKLLFDIAKQPWWKPRKALCAQVAQLELTRAKNFTAMMGHCTTAMAVISGDDNTLNILNACPDGISPIAFLESVKIGKVTLLKQRQTYESEADGLPCA